MDAPSAPPLFRFQAGPGGLQSLTAVLGAGAGAPRGRAAADRPGLSQQEILAPHPHGSAGPKVCGGGRTHAASVSRRCPSAGNIQDESSILLGKSVVIAPFHSERGEQQHRRV